MERRNFVRKSGLLFSATMLPVSGFFREPSAAYKMGLQLFTIRDAMEKDPLGSLKQVRSMGYEDLELYGFDGEAGTYYGFKADAFKQILDDHELTTSSCHYGLPDYFDKPEEELIRYVDQCIEGAHILKQSYITWPWLAPEFRTLDHFKALAEKLNQIGERVTAAGLGFAYHNHGFEFEDKGNGNGYDIILGDTDAGLVKLQLDLYWVMHSSVRSPKELISLQPGRFVMWHIKDMDKVTRDYTELGNGSIDYHAILPDPKRSGLEFYYIEQGGNFTANSMKSISDSATYFKEQLRQYL